MRPITRRGFAARLAAVLSMALPNTSRAQGNATGKAVGTGSAQPITIGFAEALTGGLAAVGKSGILAMQIWAEDVNAKGGLLGRPVKLVFYDNQSNPANVPGIYVKLLEIDHVDLVISGYSTNMTAPAMPVVMGHNKLFVSLFCLAVNSEFHYPRYFSMLPIGPDPKHAFSQEYFDLAMTLTPKPKTVAIVAADAEFARNASDGARDNAKAAGLKIVYDSTYPPTTADYSPIVRAVRAANADIIYVASYPPDTAGILRAASEIGLEAQLFGGGMVGVATAALKTQLGPLLNGVVVQQNWVPAPTLQYPGRHGVPRPLSGQGAGRGGRSAGRVPAALGLCTDAGAAAGDRGVGSIDDAKLADLHRQPHSSRRLSATWRSARTANGPRRA